VEAWIRGFKKIVVNGIYKKKKKPKYKCNRMKMEEYTQTLTSIRDLRAVSKD
jgi:hypothetical protein